MGSGRFGLDRERRGGYPNNGDLTSKSSAAQTYGFNYDLSSNLRSVQASGPTSAEIDYVIDGMNRRIGKAATAGSGLVQEGLLYDEQRRVVAELDGSNSVLSTFVYGLKPNVPDYMVRSGTTYRIVSDWRGDVRLVLDTSKTGTAAVVQQIDCDEWGNATHLVDPACTLGGNELCFQPFGFAGGIFDATTQLVRFEARDYDPQARRWVSKDPIRFGGGQTNIYVYVGDDPINANDPTGKGPIDIVQCLLGGGSPAECWAEEQYWFCVQNPLLCSTMGGGDPCRSPPDPPGPQYPQCSGLSIDDTVRCCRNASGYRDDYPPDQCPASGSQEDSQLRNLEDCLDENL